MVWLLIIILEIHYIIVVINIQSAHNKAHTISDKVKIY